VGAGAPPALPVMPPDPAGSGTAGLSILPTAPALSAAGTSASAPGPAASEPLPPQASAGSAAVPVAGLVLVRARQDTWIQAVDANNQTLLARLVPAGEAVALNPQLPLRLRVGNVAGTEVLLRGKPVDLAAGNRDNIANLTLQ
jgi:cytoskeleton protein RodZ